MRFKGKTGILFWSVVIGTDSLLLYCLFTSAGWDWMIVLFTAFMVNLIFIPLVVKNYVEIEDGRLIQVIGFCRDGMDIHEITEMYRTHNPIAAGALSLDRIMIKGKKRTMLVSVCDKEQLFAELKRLNPAIHIR